MKQLKFGGSEVSLDTNITEELRLEGLSRDIVRAIQQLRKDSGFNIEDRIQTWYDADGQVARAFASQAEYIKAETLSVELNRGRAEGLSGKSVKIDGEDVWLGLKQVS